MEVTNFGDILWSVITNINNKYEHSGSENTLKTNKKTTILNIYFLVSLLAAKQCLQISFLHFEQ